MTSKTTGLLAALAFAICASSPASAREWVLDHGRYTQLRTDGDAPGQGEGFDSYLRHMNPDQYQRDDRDDDTSPGPRSDEIARRTRSNIPAIEVPYSGPERPGTIVISTEDKRLRLIEDGGMAREYGIGVGKEGFAWSGTEHISRKAEWPGWTPPAEMMRRRPDLPSHMNGGLNNPLGARALYLGNSLYRIHGTNEPDTIGRAVSSGCIRMTNTDVIDLYGRVPVGATVVVR